MEMMHQTLFVIVTFAVGFQGNIDCFSRCTGSDCAIEMNASPVLYPPTCANICDRSQASCGKVALLGSNFDHKSDMKCKIQVIKSTDDADGTHVENESTTAAITKSFGEVLCPLGNVRKRRSDSSSSAEHTHLLVSVSNNAINYSDPVPMVIFDSTCTTCNISDGRIDCKKKNDICVIGDVCYSLSSKKCHSEKLLDDDDGDDRDEDDNDEINSELWVIGAVLGGLALIAIIGIVLYKTFVKPKMQVRDQLNGEI